VIIYEKKIVREAAKFKYGYPKYFLPDNVDIPPTGKIVSNEGPVAWTPAALVGNPLEMQTGESYVKRLKKATIEGQSRYDQCLQTDGAGYPGYKEETADFGYLPDPQYQAGFVCYVFVLNVFKNAGIAISEFGGNLNNFLTMNNYHKITDITTVQIGDLVLYNWDGSGYGHIGIITQIYDRNNPKSHSVISCIGIAEYFKYGVKEHAVGAFDLSRNGGALTSFPFPDYTFDFYTK
jgi:CHAP domain.